jgi:hypothetical protein
VSLETAWSDRYQVVGYGAASGREVPREHWPNVRSTKAGLLPSAAPTLRSVCSRWPATVRIEPVVTASARYGNVSSWKPAVKVNERCQIGDAIVRAALICFSPINLWWWS